MTLVGKFFIERMGEHVAMGKVMEQIEPVFYLVTYYFTDPDPPSLLKPVTQLATDDYRFFTSKEGALAELRRLSEAPDRVVNLVKS
jgi:hypothetical protein